ncbi:hypothetical protein LSAT2_026080 [Lamellibrachia satsuma]|nr:hypothetical protein LSAT2_026080 [Lamellibrachia satsuma]
MDNMDDVSVGDDSPRLKVCPVQGCGRRKLHVICHLHTYRCMEKSDASAMYAATFPPRLIGKTPQRHRRLRKCEVCEKLLRRLDIHLRKTRTTSKDYAATMLRTEKERHRQEVRQQRTVNLSPPQQQGRSVLARGNI